MARSPQDEYGEEGSVPKQVPLTGSGASSINIHASPEDFGAQVGQGLQKFGASGEEVANHFNEMAVHTATNDAYVNGYAPEVNNLVSNYKKLSGADAYSQKDAYENQLKTINNKYLNMGSPMQQELMGSLVARHTISTMDNMSNHADQQWAQHEQIVTNQSIKNAGDEAMNNWQKPDDVEFNVNRAMGIANLDATRKVGYDSESQKVAQQLSREAGSSVAASAINMAIDNRDYTTANAYKLKYGDLLSGKQKLEIEQKLQSVNIDNNSSNIADNLLTGRPIVQPGTQLHQDIQTKATIADLARKNNFDPNIAFALHGAESDYGRNKNGVFKDDFQTNSQYRDKGFEDDSIESSMHNGVKIWNENVPTFETALGRKATPAEGYLAYNQGGGGAIALYGAKPNETAVDALSKIMSPEQAMQHVLKNGGTDTMSAADFMKSREDWFNTHYDSQKASNTSPEAIKAQTNVRLPSIQQTSNPHELFNQMNDRLPAAQAGADAITDDKLREATQKKLKYQYEQAKLADTAWKNQQAQIVDKIADNSRYTSMDQIPQSIKSNLRDAGQLTAMERVFDDKNNPRPKDNTYGDMAFLRTMDKVATDDKTDAITDLAGLQQEYGDNPGLHSSGFNRLKGMVKAASTPEGKATIASQSQFLSDLRQKMVAGEADTQGKANFEKAIPLFFSQYENAAKDGKQADILKFDDKNEFIKSLNLPNAAQLTSKKIDNSVSWLSSLFGGGTSAPPPPIPTPLSKEAQSAINQVPRPE